MIKFLADGKDGRSLMGIGLEAENLDRLMKDQPIVFDAKPFGFDGTILIFYGPTPAAMIAKLKAEGFAVPEDMT